MMLFHYTNHFSDKARIMLAVAVKLQRHIIALFLRIAHACVNGVAQSAIHRQIQHRIAVLTANACRRVPRTVVDNQVIVFRADALKMLHDLSNIQRFVIGRNHN